MPTRGEMVTSDPRVKAYKALELGRALRALGRSARRDGGLEHVVLRAGPYVYVLAVQDDGTWLWQQWTASWHLYMWHGTLATPAMAPVADAAAELVALVEGRRLPVD